MVILAQLYFTVLSSTGTAVPESYIILKVKKTKLKENETAPYRYVSIKRHLCVTEK